MKKSKQYGILWYVDNDKKTYNPGVIVTEEGDQEITEVTYKMQQERRNVNIFVSNVVDDISDLPPLDQAAGDPVHDYEYDPFLMW